MLLSKKFFCSSIINPAFFVLAVYLLVYIRQYLWFSDLFFFVWIIPSLISLYLTFLIVKKLNYSKINIEFILIVGLPILFFYILRFAFPDASWDIINYHYLNGERGLKGYPFIKGDFPYLSLANSSTDMITGIYRKLFGHRLGTIVNLFVIFWSAQVLEKIISQFTSKKIIKYSLVLLLLAFEGITYQISNYWIELLSIPLILELVYFLNFKKKKNYDDYIIIALFSGILLSFKLVNLVLIIPLAILFLIQYINDIKDILLKKILKLFFLLVIFFIPLIPYNFYMFFLTGNPVYPHLNWIFQSDLFHTHNNLRRPLGPKDDLQAFFWPFVMLFNSERLSNTPVYPFLTFAAYVCSILILILNVLIKNKILRNLNFILIFYITSVFLWGYLSGDFRFVYFFEILAGLIIITIFYRYFIENEKTIFKIENLKINNRLFLIIFICIVVLKYGVTLNKALKYEWAERPTIISNFKEYRENLKYVFRDYSLISSVSNEEKKNFSSTNAWISSSPVVSGYMALLNNKIPYVDFHHLPMRGKKGNQLFQKTIKENGAIIYTSIIREGTLGLDLEWSINELIKHDFKPLMLRRLDLPFYSGSSKTLYIKKLTVLEVVHENYFNQISKKLSQKEILKKKSSLVIPKWIDGCSGLEQNNSTSWRWCENNFSLLFKNFSDIEIGINFNFQINSVSEKFSDLNFKIKEQNFSYKINNTPKLVSKKIKIMPGEEYAIKFLTNAPKLEGTSDPRKLHVMITKFNYQTNFIEN